MIQNRVVDIHGGVAMIVTDLHGEGNVYRHLRDTFLDYYRLGEADRLIICGDLIHGYGSVEQDASLGMLLDVMRLQEELGEDVVTMLLGNHEMPHIYSVTLSRGDVEFTSRFEHSLNQLKDYAESLYVRYDVIEFLKSLPLYARTRAGVTLTHAGATPAILAVRDAELMVCLDHDYVLEMGDALLGEYPLDSLMNNAAYRQQVKKFLDIDDTRHPRFTDLFRGHLLSQRSAVFNTLWDVLFTVNEKSKGIDYYQQQVEVFLKSMSAISPFEQRLIIAGHMGAKGGYAKVGKQQLRLATYSHAYPKTEGRYLLLNCSRQVHQVEDLYPYLRRTF